MSLNLYFDNSASSFPKPKELETAALNYLRRGGNYGRASYGKAIENLRIVEGCRDMLAAKFGISAESLFFTKNATEASNLILNSLNLKDKRVLCSPMEHNAVMRPLNNIGAIIDIFECNSDGSIDLQAAANIDYSKYDLVCVNHVSNVNGVVQPIDKISTLVENQSELFIDASQSVGALNFDFVGDYVIFTAHKSLYGAVGVGGFYAKNSEKLSPLTLGGTGSNSESFEMPSFTPDKFQAGTINILGIEMLFSALKNPPTYCHTKEDFNDLLTKIEQLKTVKLYKANNINMQAEIFSLNFNNIEISNAADKLYFDFGIELRKGLHCSPLAHKTIGSFPNGTLRFSLSAYHNINDINFLYSAIETLSKY